MACCTHLLEKTILKNEIKNYNMKTVLLFLSLSLLPFICLSQSKQVSVFISDGLSNTTLKQKIELNTAQLLSVINSSYVTRQKDLYLSPKYATQNVIDMLDRFWLNCPFYCSTDVISQPILNENKRLLIRHVPLIIQGDKSYFKIEYSEEGKVDNIEMALDLDFYSKMLDSDGKVDEERRLIILNFVESLRTSYMLKDIDEIEKLYSDKALIITGKVLEQVDRPVDYMKNTFTKEQIIYQVQTKKQYIDNLRKVFNKVAYVKLEFTDIIGPVRHRKNPSFYGVRLNQHWRTSEYEDNGILFLLIQFKENEDPVIWVRTWQNADSTSEDEVFGLHNFKIDQSKIY